MRRALNLPIARAAVARRFAAVKLYTETHEWVSIDEEKKTATVGISKQSADHLGQILLVGLPATGDGFAAEDELCDIESVKAAAKVFAPVSGKVSAVNKGVDADEGTPAKAGTHAEDESEAGGWLVKLEDAQKSGSLKYMTAEQYAKFLEDEPLK